MKLRQSTLLQMVFRPNVLILLQKDSSWWQFSDSGLLLVLLLTSNYRTITTTKPEGGRMSQQKFLRARSQERASRQEPAQDSVT